MYIHSKYHKHMVYGIRVIIIITHRHTHTHTHEHHCFELVWSLASPSCRWMSDPKSAIAVIAARLFMTQYYHLLPTVTGLMMFCGWQVSEFSRGFATMSSRGALVDAQDPGNQGCVSILRHGTRTFHHGEHGSVLEAWPVTASAGQTSLPCQTARKIHT